MSGHTPGPWAFDSREHTVSSEGLLVGRVSISGGRIPLPEARANGALFAAAPELLEALRDMVSDHTELSEATLKFARAAIAKATGEPQ